jgi:hypothetical protein
MRIEGNQVVLERKNCHMCDHGTQPTKKWKVCSKCNGTGKKGNGRCRECNSRTYWDQKALRPGYVMFYDHADRQFCETCGGNYEGFRAETMTDTIDITHIPIEVQRNGRQQSWVEQHIGVGVYTIMDYGHHKNQTDDEIIAKVRKEMHRVQACKVVRSDDDPTICDKLVIVTADTGFSAVPRWS